MTHKTKIHFSNLTWALAWMTRQVFNTAFCWRVLSCQLKVMEWRFWSYILWLGGTFLAGLWLVSTDFYLISTVEVIMFRNTVPLDRTQFYLTTKVLKVHKTSSLLISKRCILMLRPVTICYGLGWLRLCPILTCDISKWVIAITF